MLPVLLGLIILACVLLVLIVLAQNSKGGGLTSQFGGAGASNMIGVKKTGDLLEKLTWGLITAIFVLSLSTKFFTDSGQVQRTDEFIDRAKEQTTVPALDLGGTSGEQPTEQPVEGDAAGDLEDLKTDDSSE